LALAETKAARAAITAASLVATPSSLTRALRGFNDAKFGSTEDNFAVLPSLLKQLKLAYGNNFTYKMMPADAPARVAEDDAPVVFESVGFVMPYASALLEYGLPLYAIDGAHSKYQSKELGGTWSFVVQ
jgi:hypothetical protein